MHISLVAAIGENFELGGKGNLLWRLPNDMQKFKQITSGHHVLMGRKTYESLPPKFRPLPERVNIVLTENSHFQAQGCFVVNNLADALELAQKAGESDLMVIGGAKIYNQCLPLADTLYITKVHGTFPEADVYFPDWNDSKWNLVSAEHADKDDKHAYPYTFTKLERIKG